MSTATLGMLALSAYGAFLLGTVLVAYRLPATALSASVVSLTVASLLTLTVALPGALRARRTAG